MRTAQAATLVAPGRLEVRDYPLPEALEPGAVLLRMLASGICGTDKHTFRGETEQYAGTEYARSTPFPIIQGHENVGVAEWVGPRGALAWDGRPLVPGDRVVPAPNRACGRCRFGCAVSRTTSAATWRTTATRSPAAARAQRLAGAQVVDDLDGRTADVVVDATGFPGSFAQAV